jgi:hypothetical protein
VNWFYDGKLFLKHCLAVPQILARVVDSERFGNFLFFYILTLHQFSPTDLLAPGIDMHILHVLLLASFSFLNLAFLQCLYTVPVSSC